MCKISVTTRLQQSGSDSVEPRVITQVGTPLQHENNPHPFGQGANNEGLEKIIFIPHWERARETRFSQCFAQNATANFVFVLFKPSLSTLVDNPYIGRISAIVVITIDMESIFVLPNLNVVAGTEQA